MLTTVESDFYRRKSFDLLRENEEFVKLELTQAAQKLAEECQSAFKRDPLSASKIAPLARG